jgi:hypothetical protein
MESVQVGQCMYRHPEYAKYGTTVKSEIEVLSGPPDSSTITGPYPPCGTEVTPDGRY